MAREVSHTTLRLGEEHVATLLSLCLGCLATSYVSASPQQPQCKPLAVFPSRRSPLIRDHPPCGSSLLLSINSQL
ncbi:hypothetical protein C8Q74DRAFT_594192 [Fomes fomentarius]|nr:hypothetical protein C8Q74DRAFT_594192 [Fomes fomentarius]